MRASALFLVTIVMLCSVSVTPALAQSAAPAAFDRAGTTAGHVKAFLKTLQQAVALDNRLKVASLMKFPLEAWIDGEKVTLRNEREFFANYTRIFDAAMKKSIAGARVDSLTTDTRGIVLDGGRLWCQPQGGRQDVLKIVAINKLQ
jgi:hypothetical protein